MEDVMTGLIVQSARGTVLAAALVAVSAGWANAAPATVGTNTNLRQGPGTNFAVITTVPAGAVVDVIRCGGTWCNVMANGSPGYMIARNIGLGGAPVPVAPPPGPVVVGPPVVYGPGPYYGPGFYGPRFYGPGFYYGPRRYWRRW
jgi:uncharacterized protein YraI